MTHFFANPLSVFLDTTKELESIQTEHFEAVRNLPSFRRFVGKRSTARDCAELKPYPDMHSVSSNGKSTRC